MTTTKEKTSTKTDEPYQGCPCIAHNVQLAELDNVEREGRIEFGQTSEDALETNFSTLTHPLLWSGSDLLIPQTGIYYTEISFVREFGSTSDDVFVKLFARPPGGSLREIGYAWAGENSTRARQTAHYSIVTKFEAGTELYLESSSDGGRAAVIRNLSWTTFHLCCNPALEVPLPC